MWQQQNICQQGKPLCKVKLNGEELNNVDHVKYLGSVTDADGAIDRDVDLRVQAEWSRWIQLAGVVYDRKIPFRLIAKIYWAITRLTLTHGNEC